MAKVNNQPQKKENLLALRHSVEHVLTQAMINLYGKDKVIMAMGPATDDGFYFDFDSPGDFKISEADFPKIEKEMKKIIKADLPLKRKEIPVKEARKLFKGNPYKQEWLDEIEKDGKKAIVYWTGDDFVDLCSGPHIVSTGEIKAFKLLSVAGAYWHGHEKNKMLTRIYGTAFETREELDKYLKRLEEAKKRDHRILGRQLDIFVINEDIGRGLPLLTPKGTIIRNQILEFEQILEKEAGFEQVWTPHIAKNELYKRTGHWEHFRDVMYSPFGIDNETYVLKPMNCPHHYMIYNSKPRSYKDLPVRYAEAGTCYRYEKSGEIGGLTRVRALSIDDAHILMREDQIDAELDLCIKMVLVIFKAFGLKKYWVRLSLNDPDDKVKYMTDSAHWKKAGEKLEEAVNRNKLEYRLAKGEASFYGPKIDFMAEDALGREWQMSTLQLDLFMAKKLDLAYVDKEGKNQHPVILHRGLTGSIERTIGLLIEHFAGAFPLWLAPVQVLVLPITDKVAAYAKTVSHSLKKAGIRAELDDSDETLSKKIRKAEIQKVPYMLVVGEKEEKEKKVTVRQRGQEKQEALDLTDFSKKIKQEIEEKTIF